MLLAVLLLVSGEGQTRERVPVHAQRALLCIHRFEGAWNARTGNGYYGGLQMDLGFQRTYGTWLFRHRGTADRWRVDQQIRVAYRAVRGWKGYRGRGYTPWPSTARRCGLI